MSISLILAAYFAGLCAKLIHLPPLIGYLLAGFLLHLSGFTINPDVQVIADLGITLMLFTIGLKINIKDLLHTQVWGSAASHMVLWSLCCFLINALFAAIGLLLYDLELAQTAVLIFALSFSSTVCVIKVLEDAGELKSRQSSIAIGVLIIQDLVAVVFLVAATGKVPEPWALILFALPFVRPFIDRLLNSTGHGELLPLSGLMLALGAYALFESVNVKGDLGALIVGMVVATSAKSSELYKSLIAFKDLFLIAFFMSIGLASLPDAHMLMLATMLLLLLPLKFLLFYIVFIALAFRARTAFLASLLLGNFSEFGLIVAALSVEEGLLDERWLVVLAIAAAQSFVITSLVYRKVHIIYAHLSPFLSKFQRKKATLGAEIEVATNAEVIVVGMGRVGLGAYKSLYSEDSRLVWGVEVDKNRVDMHKATGIKNVIAGDADDNEFWEAQDLNKVRLVMLALPCIDEMLNIMAQLKLSNYSNKIAAVAQHEDERLLLESHGVDVAFNYYLEVGNGFAEESRHLLSDT